MNTAKFYDALDPIPAPGARKARQSEEIITSTKEVAWALFWAALGGATLGAGVALFFML